jgi:hypothetical protein
MKTKTVERLLNETPEDVKKQVSTYADNLVMSKYILWAIAFLLLLDCAGTIAMYMVWKDRPLEKEDYQMFKAVKIPEDTVYIDPITVGTTTDPENL